MNAHQRPASPQHGFTLVELLVSMVISLVALAALVSIFVNLSNSHREMDKMNGVIENGRFSLQLLEDDLQHAGYWGGFVPRYDDLSETGVPGDAPTLIADPCANYATWNSAYRFAALGQPVATYGTLPAGTGCLDPLPQRAGTDVLLVRHADTCTAGVGTCDADTAGELYLQMSACMAERTAGTAQGAFAGQITLGNNASAAMNAYDRVAIRLTSGTGAGQVRYVTTYNGTTKVATVAPDWTIIPDSSTTYSLDFAFGVDAFPLHQRACIGTGTPATLPVTGGPLGAKRRYVADLFYVSDFGHPDQAGAVLPTLVRSRFSAAGAAVGQQRPVPLIEGVENIRYELGIDDTSETNEAVDYTAAVDWADPATKRQPRNRGDGIPDRFVRCTTAAPCNAADLSNVVAVKVYALVRSRDTTMGYVDSKVYCLGERDRAGDCPAGSTIAARNDAYKRHVFQTSVRLTNVSGRRETP